MLACNLRMRFAYLPSGSNPADAPSRGKRVKKVPVKLPSLAVKQALRRDDKSRALARAMAFNDDLFLRDGGTTLTGAGSSSEDRASSLS